MNIAQVCHSLNRASGLSLLSKSLIAQNACNAYCIVMCTHLDNLSWLVVFKGDGGSVWQDGKGRVPPRKQLPLRPRHRRTVGIQVTDTRRQYSIECSRQKTPV